MDDGNGFRYRSQIRLIVFTAAFPNSICIGSGGCRGLAGKKKGNNLKICSSQIFKIILNVTLRHLKKMDANISVAS